jgi:signal peptidase I
MSDPGNGTVAEDRVVGRAFVLVWPLNRWARLPVPATFKRKELDGAALAQGVSALGVATLVPLALVRRRRRGERFDPPARPALE